MSTQILKPMILGILLGAALFFMPFFLIKIFIFLLVVWAVIHLIRGRRGQGPYGWKFSDKIRQMTDEEYKEFKEKFSHGCRGYKNMETEFQKPTNI